MSEGYDKALEIFSSRKHEDKIEPELKSLYHTLSQGIKILHKKYFVDDESMRFKMIYMYNVFECASRCQTIGEASTAALILTVAIHSGINFLYTEKEGEMCGICEKEFEYWDVCRNIRCEHIFHAECICSLEICPTCGGSLTVVHDAEKIKEVYELILRKV